MLDFLENIRSKPNGAKKRIAFFTAFTFTGIIFIFWFVAIYPSFKEQNKIEEKAKKIESSPVSSLGSIFSDNFSKIKEQFIEIQDITKNFNSDANYYVASSTDSTSTVQSDSQNTANTWSAVEGDLP
jgi:preprotein translocase subunit YajC